MTASAMASMPPSYAPAYANDNVTCDWSALSTQLLEQWKRLTPVELERTQHNRHSIAQLVERKYGVYATLVENYLRNLERTLPMFA